MSPRDWKYLVDDILDAIDKIRGYVADMPFEEFEDDRCRCSEFYNNWRSRFAYACKYFERIF
jgi:uncharacterized protein with HEPN domain